MTLQQPKEGTRELRGWQDEVLIHPCSHFLDTFSLKDIPIRPDLKDRFQFVAGIFIISPTISTAYNNLMVLG